MSNIRHLRLQQLNKQLTPWGQAAPITPPNGWIATLRKALGMPLRSLGARLGITAEGAKRMELREADGTISLQLLRKAAEAMDMRLAYVFVPKDGSLEKLIERRALAMATDIVMRTHQSMKLEGQAVSDERLMEAIAEQAAELRRELPKQLWD
ncbi:MAG: mobile mystery protein A [Flavobacteriales bacterium]|nr:mobile mystery protein A [Flavobacteriales bacterium]